MYGKFWALAFQLLFHLARGLGKRRASFKALVLHQLFGFAFYTLQMKVNSRIVNAVNAYAVSSSAPLKP
jgi:drug/metabolite transporter (DMT)-like permease